jgi:hypothetical protein
MTVRITTTSNMLTLTDVNNVQYYEDRQQVINQGLHLYPQW